MKKNIIITIIGVLILTCIFALARTTTTDLELVKPTWSEDIDILNDINTNSDILEAFANDPLKFDTGERLEDRVGAMLDENTETFLTLTYQDEDNTIDGVVPVLDQDDMAANSAAYLATQQSIKAYVDNFTGSTNIVTVGTIGTGVWQGTAIADGYIPDNITIDLATLATTFACTDNEDSAETIFVVFVDGATGAQGAETDGDLTYNPNTGALTAKMHRVYSVSETTAQNAGWWEIQTTATTGDLTGLRTVMRSNAASGDLNVRGVYGQGVVEAGKYAGTLQGGLFTASNVGGTGNIDDVYVLGAHYSSGAGTEVSGDFYLGFLKSQTRTTGARSVTGHDVLLGLENEAIEGTGMTMDSAIRVFDTNLGARDGFTYGIDMSDADIGTDIKLSDSHTIIDSATGIAISLLNPTTITGLGDVTSTDDDYVLIWDATDNTLKKCDMGEVRGGNGNGATAWDDITNPDANDEIDFAAYVIELNVEDFRIGDGGNNYVKFADAGVMTFEGTANIKTVPFASLYDNGSSGAAPDIDWTNGNYQEITTDQNMLFTFSNVHIGTITIRITYGGDHEVGFNAEYTILEEGGTEIVFSETTAEVDILKVMYLGTADNYVVGAMLDVK